MLIYNSENECYSRFIPIDQAAEIQEKIKKLETRLQNMPVNPIDQTECTDELDIDDVNALKELLNQYADKPPPCQFVPGCLLLLLR